MKRISLTKTLSAVMVMTLLGQPAAQAGGWGWSHGWRNDHYRGYDRDYGRRYDRGYNRGYRHSSRDNWVGLGVAALVVGGVALAVSNSSRNTSTSVSYSTYPQRYYSPPVYVAPPVVYSSPVTYVAPPVVYAPPVTYAAPPVIYSGPNPVYAAPAPVVATTAPVVVAPAPTSIVPNVVAFPAKGQSNAQQVTDRQFCQNWATNQSGFDPGYVTQWTTSANTDTYQRAMDACLKGKGYTTG